MVFVAKVHLGPKGRKLALVGSAGKMLYSGHVIDSVQALLSDPPRSLHWYAVRVKSNFEKTAAQSLACRQFEQFVPTYRQTRRWSDRTKTIEAPLFPGYIFCRLDPDSRTSVLSTPGVVGIVSAGGRLLPVDEEEVNAVRRASTEAAPLVPAPYLATGHRVRVLHGALRGIEGIVLEDSGACRLVLQISLLQRSVSLQIDRSAVETTTACSPANA